MNIPHDHRSLKRIPLFHRTREITGLGHHQKILKPAKLNHAPRFDAGRA
jgi:hypothetical protein